VGRFAHGIPEFEAQPGSYAARNRALTVARGEIFAFTDSDCIPDQRWLEEGVSGLQSRNAGLIAGRVEVFAARPDRPNPIEAYDIMHAFRQERYVELGFAPTVNLFARRDVLDRVGPFDARLKSGGDREWTSRAVAAGCSLAYHDEALVMHPARRSLSELNQRLARIAGGHFDRSRSNRKELMRERIYAAQRILAPAKLAVNLVRSPTQIAQADRFKVIMVGAVANWAYVLEWVRLELGAQTRR
jgi:cellulose synthase/poly-beta-1,6-N-acetylglucosamine synthase-like glycosyltransferase